jgi:hypothetical protein
VKASELSNLQRWLVRLGLLLLIPSLMYLPFVMLDFANADFLAIGGTSGIKVLGSCAVLGCLVTASGYWGS